MLTGNAGHAANGIYRQKGEIVRLIARHEIDLRGLIESHNGIGGSELKSQY